MMHSYTKEDIRKVNEELVLILVVMDDALVRMSVQFTLKGGGRVLILVVMDDALVHGLKGSEASKICLNPCCNG